MVGHCITESISYIWPVEYNKIKQYPLQSHFGEDVDDRKHFDDPRLARKACFLSPLEPGIDCSQKYVRDSTQICPPPQKCSQASTCHCGDGGGGGESEVSPASRLASHWGQDVVPGTVLIGKKEKNSKEKAENWGRQANVLGLKTFFGSSLGSDMLVLWLLLHDSSQFSNKKSRMWMTLNYSFNLFDFTVILQASQASV